LRASRAGSATSLFCRPAPRPPCDTTRQWRDLRSRHCFMFCSLAPSGADARCAWSDQRSSSPAGAKPRPRQAVVRGASIDRRGFPCSSSSKLLAFVAVAFSALLGSAAVVSGPAWAWKSSCDKTPVADAKPEVAYLFLIVYLHGLHSSTPRLSYFSHRLVRPVTVCDRQRHDGICVHHRYRAPSFW
jgi:hypothetical protein